MILNITTLTGAEEGKRRGVFWSGRGVSVNVTWGKEQQLDVTYGLKIRLFLLRYSVPYWPWGSQPRLLWW